MSCSIEHVFKKIAFLQRKKFVRNCQIPSISPRLTVAIRNPKSTSTYVNEVCLLVHSNCKRHMEINCFSKPSICGEIINDLNYCLAYRFFGNVQFNWPKLFQAFSAKFTLIFFMSVFIQSFHISTCKNYAY